MSSFVGAFLRRVHVLLARLDNWLWSAYYGWDTKSAARWRNR